MVFERVVYSSSCGTGLDILSPPVYGSSQVEGCDSYKLYSELYLAYLEVIKNGTVFVVGGGECGRSGGGTDNGCNGNVGSRGAFGVASGAVGTAPHFRLGDIGHGERSDVGRRGSLDNARITVTDGIVGVSSDCPGGDGGGVFGDVSGESNAADGNSVGPVDVASKAVADECDTAAAGAPVADGSGLRQSTGVTPRGKHWRRNLARRKARQSGKVCGSIASSSLCGKWVAENNLAAFKAERELEVLRSQKLDAVVRMRAAKVTAATELAKVKIEKAFSTLSKSDNAYTPGLSDGGSISPGSSASMAEYRAVQKRNIDLEARVVELEKLLASGSKSSCEFEGLTVDSQGNYDLDAARAIAGSVYGGAYLANGRFDPLAQVEDNMDFYSYNDGSN